jgi:hypothetical protein
MLIYLLCSHVVTLLMEINVYFRCFVVIFGTCCVVCCWQVLFACRIMYFYRDLYYWCMLYCIWLCTTSTEWIYGELHIPLSLSYLINKQNTLNREIFYSTVKYNILSWEMSMSGECCITWPVCATWLIKISRSPLHAFWWGKRLTCPCA